MTKSEQDLVVMVLSSPRAPADRDDAVPAACSPGSVAMDEQCGGHGHGPADPHRSDR